MKRRLSWLVAVGVLASAFGFHAGRAAADGVPATDGLRYGGRLLDKLGQPVETPTAVQLSLFTNGKTGDGVAVCASTPVMSSAKTGLFSIPLPASCAAAIHKHADLFVEIAIGAKSKTVLPRTRLTAVPYALEAASSQVAAGASGKLKADIDEIANAKTRASALKLEVGTGSGSASAKLTTAGGSLLLIASGGMSGGGSPNGIEITIDGKVVLASKGYQSSGTKLRFHETAIVSSITAGVHVVEAKKTSAGSAGVSLTVIEVPK